MLRQRQPAGRRRGRRERAALIGGFVDLILAGDSGGAVALALELQSAWGRRVDIFADLIHPAQYQIGERWYSGEIGVADEHRATAVVERVVEALPPSPAARPVGPDARCLLAAIDGSAHLLGLRVLQLALEDEGWRVQRLGACSASEFEAAGSRLRPRWAGLSAGYLPVHRPARLAIEALHRLSIRVLVGGSAFNRAPGLWERLGADAMAADARTTLVLARRWAP